MAKRKTNLQCVRDMMEFSQFGPLAQGFVMEAIAQYANQVSTASPDQIADNAFISSEAWIGVAKEIKGKMDTHLAH